LYSRDRIEAVADERITLLPRSGEHDLLR